MNEHWMKQFMWPTMYGQPTFYPSPSVTSQYPRDRSQLIYHNPFLKSSLWVKYIDGMLNSVAYQQVPAIGNEQVVASAHVGFDDIGIIRNIWFYPYSLATLNK